MYKRLVSLAVGNSSEACHSWNLQTQPWLQGVQGSFLPLCPEALRPAQADLLVPQDPHVQGRHHWGVVGQDAQPRTSLEI